MTPKLMKKQGKGYGVREQNDDRKIARDDIRAPNPHTILVSILSLAISADARIPVKYIIPTLTAPTVVMFSSVSSRSLCRAGIRTPKP